MPDPVCTSASHVTLGMVPRRVHWCERVNGGREETDETQMPEQPPKKQAATKKPAPKKRGRKPRVALSEQSQVSVNTGKDKSVESSSDALSHDSGMQLILSQLRSIREEVAVAREEDRRETRKAIDALTERFEAPTSSSDEEVPVPPKQSRTTVAKQKKGCEPSMSETDQASAQPFARLARRDDISGGAAITPEMVQNALDPIARLKGDRISSAQAQLIMSAVVGQDSEAENSNIESGYYRTLNDIKKYHVPWPNDTIYRSNGKKALYDSLSVSEFVMGYCNIIASTLKVGAETAQAFDHISYLIDVMSDVDSAGWDIVLSSHRQILHMAETGQMKWENAEARNIARSKHVTRAEKAVASKLAVLNVPKGQGQQSLKGRPCAAFQTGDCTYQGGHFSSGQQWAHICATCLRVSGQRNVHNQGDCRRKKAHESYMAKAAADGKVQP